MPLFIRWTAIAVLTVVVVALCFFLAGMNPSVLSACLVFFGTGYLLARDSKRHNYSGCLPRMVGTILLTMIIVLAIVAFDPLKLPVVMFKLLMISLAGVAGYWLDRELFPYARPDRFIGEGDSDAETEAVAPCESGANVLASLFAGSMIRRAIVVGAAMLAMGLGN